MKERTRPTSLSWDWGASNKVLSIISAIVSKEGGDAWLKDVGMRALLALTERTRLDCTPNEYTWEHTRPDIMIKIHPPYVQKVRIFGAWDNLCKDRIQSLVVGRIVNKIAKDSDVNQVFTNNFAPIDRLLKGLLKSQADIIRIHCVADVLKSERNFGEQRSHAQIVVKDWRVGCEFESKRMNEESRLLRRGKTTSCSCPSRPPRFKDWQWRIRSTTAAPDASRKPYQILVLPSPSFSSPPAASSA